MYFESFHPGLQSVTQWRTVNASELDAFLKIADLHLPMFLSDEGAQEVGHARRLVTGPMIFSVAMGLVRATGWFDQVVAGLEFNEMRFLKAVHPGDSLRARTTVMEARKTRDPRRGLVVLAFVVSNQDETPVLEMKGTYLFRIGAQSVVASIEKASQDE
ncbi:MAG: MaoC/PaaZ C-terminal domain-containing protein [Bacteroidota bacterium]